MLFGLVALGLVATACSESADADPATYFEALRAAQTDLESDVEAVWEGDAANEVQTFADDDVPASLTAEQDDAVHRFIDEFWTHLGQAADRHRSRVDDLDVPDSLEELHDRYVDTFDALVGSTDDRIELAASTPGTQLLSEFWESTPEIEAVDGACDALQVEAALLDLAIVLPLCADG